MGETTLKLHNTLTRAKEDFVPIDPNNVRMYVCGPTVYDYAHIGNARPVIVFDLLYRLLRHVYGADHVTYVRNITDVDDKINARALHDHPELPLNEAIRRVTETTADQYQKDTRALGTLEPTHQPRATDNIPGMQSLIGKLLRKKGTHGSRYAYQAADEVLFNVSAMKDYGELSGRDLTGNLAGARVAVDSHKRDPADFVLWKRSASEEPGWDSPWGMGRPGWHIECSAMSERYLGKEFDIHGGGLDLIFPHHENEIAQSRSAHGTSTMARYWLHNGFLQVEGEKMSKSLGNFITVHELLETDKFGGRSWDGPVLRLAMLMTHYRDPIDFTVKRLEEAEQKLKSWQDFASERSSFPKRRALEASVLAALCDDLGTKEAIDRIDAVVKSKKPRESDRHAVFAAAKLLGFELPRSAFVTAAAGLSALVESISRRSESNLRNLFWTAVANPVLPSGKFRPHARALADLIALRDWANANLPKASERTEVSPFWEHVFASKALLTPPVSDFEAEVERRVTDRLAALNAKDFARADTIRAELLTQGVQLMDYKDEAGNRQTKWELVR